MLSLVVVAVGVVVVVRCWLFLAVLLATSGYSYEVLFSWSHLTKMLSSCKCSSSKLESDNNSGVGDYRGPTGAWTVRRMNELRAAVKAKEASAEEEEELAKLELEAKKKGAAKKKVVFQHCVCPITSLFFMVVDYCVFVFFMVVLFFMVIIRIMMWSPNNNSTIIIIIRRTTTRIIRILRIITIIRIMTRKRQNNYYRQ